MHFKGSLLRKDKKKKKNQQHRFLAKSEPRRRVLGQPNGDSPHLGESRWNKLEWSSWLAALVRPPLHLGTSGLATMSGV